jgi:hypothetical protein
MKEKTRTSVPTDPPTSTNAALMNFFSTSWTSGSFIDRPINLFNEPMVFLKFEVSCVFAASPIARCFGPNATSDLHVRDRQYFPKEHILAHARCSTI